jgi:Putative peptidoglycan binding domain
VARGRPASLADRVLALQRTAGNAAVARLVAAGTVLRAPRTRLARLTEPPYKPNPTWSQKGKANPGLDCTPYPGLFGRSPGAHLAWQELAKRVPGEVTARCGCSLVGDAYATYLEAGGKFNTLADDGNCISSQLAKDDKAHAVLEDRLVDQWRDRGNDVVRQALTAGGDVEIDLVKALEGSFVPATPGSLGERNVNRDVTYRDNTLAGGLLFGSASEDGTTSDSEFGPDTRWLTGTIKLHPIGSPAPDTVDVEETLTFHYRTRDALDFCPGNTNKKPWTSWENVKYNELLTGFSRLEASGMARDVGFDVRYHRTKTIHRRLSRPAPPQPPTPPPEPKPAPKPGPKPAPKPRPKPEPKPGPKPRPGSRLTAVRFIGLDGEPEPTLQACFEDRARLREGDSGEPVRVVQQALVDLTPPLDLGRSGPAGDGVDGRYGPKTAAAVRAFKTREGLGYTQYGDVGPGTMRRLNELFSA